MRTALITLTAFLIGCALPVLFALSRSALSRLWGTIGGIAGAIIASVFSLALCSVALIYLSTFRGGFPPFTALAFMLGIALVRWLRKEL